MSSMKDSRLCWRRIPAAVAGITAAALALTGPATAETGGPASLTAARRAVFQLAGQVRNGTPLDGHADDTRIVVPQGLPVVARARVSIPRLSLSVTTDSRGRFALFVPAASARAGISVMVTARGFGTWEESGIRLSSGGPTSLYVELHHAVRFFAAPRPGRQRYNGAARRPGRVCALRA